MAILSGLLGALQACQHEPQPDFRIIAPAFDATHVRFTNYDLLPVGGFAETRGRRMPFVDSNQDGHFDPDLEANGRCDQSSRECRLDDHRLRVINSRTDCPVTTGLWLSGDVYDATGRNMKATLCDNQGVCSRPHEHVFENESMNAIWLPDPSTASGRRTFSLSAGLSRFRYDSVELPAPIQLVSTNMERHGDLRVSLTSDQTIDLVFVRLMRAGTLRWSSSQQPDRVHADGRMIVIDLPAAVIDSCGSNCEAHVQLAHVWRDDDVLSVSQVEHRIF